MVKHAMIFYLTILLISFGMLKNKKIGMVFAGIGWVLTIIDLVTYKLTNAHIDYFIVSRMDKTMIEMAIEVVPKYVYGGIIGTFVVVIFHYFLYKNPKICRPTNRKTYFLLVVLVFFGLCTSKTSKAYMNLVKQVKNNYEYSLLSIDDVLGRLGATGTYLLYDEIFAKAGKNLVIIYCESLEQNLLNNKELNATKNLDAMVRNGWHLYENYNCLYGSTWTVGSLYATQTGLPTLFSTDGNEIFNRVFRTQAASYTSVLKKAGYNNLFLTGCNLSFAGTGNMMRNFGYEIKGAECYGENAVRNQWGVQDYDLFEKAKEEYLRLDSLGKPFNLTLLTVDTHFPKGCPDKRMENFIGKMDENGSHKFTIASLDYLLKDFVDFIKNNTVGDEPIIVIIGDHLMMGDKKLTPLVEYLDKSPRKVVLLTNRAIDGMEYNKYVAFYDIPEIILALTDVEHNVKFGKKLFPEISVQFIVENSVLFNVLNQKLN